MKNICHTVYIDLNKRGFRFDQQSVKKNLSTSKGLTKFYRLNSLCGV